MEHVDSQIRLKSLYSQYVITCSGLCCQCFRPFQRLAYPLLLSNFSLGIYVDDAMAFTKRSYMRYKTARYKTDGDQKATFYALIKGYRLTVRFAWRTIDSFPRFS
ncbi:hypothetical protein DESC_930052 [Desulfosarcina cetonica]|nr:hypothetical protein DESC_930052 [Desulfosarcina cetonica]